MNTKTKVISAVVIALTVATISMGSVYASNNANGTNPMSGLVSAIAKKFNLSESAVQGVFDEQRTLQQAQRQAQVQQQFTDRIAGAVVNGKLTQAQANLITAKHKELQDLRDTLNDKSLAERQSAMQAQRDSLEKWATDNNIPRDYMFFAGGNGMGKGRGMGGRGMGVGHMFNK